jgi:protoporphyrinogen/coproporphyrinogen III oxidase
MSTVVPWPGVGVPRVVIVGGGIAGLAAARAIRAQVPAADVVVLERSERPGGNIRSERIDGYLCENGPDGFLDNAPATLEFVDEIGLSPRLMPSRDEARRRFIFRRNRLYEVPLSPAGFASTGLLSMASKLRVLAEPLSARAPRHDESILEFAQRHIGREAAQVLVGSMVSGIFAGDASHLSLRACFPKMREMDTRYGSLVRAMLAKRREKRASNGMGAPAGRLTSFTEGMEDLIRAAVTSLGPAMRTNRRVIGLQHRYSAAHTGPRLVGSRAFSVECEGQRIEADAVVLAGPSSESANLLRPFAPVAATLLGAIDTAPIAVACLGYDAAALAADRGPLDGFGFLVPRGEGPRILGALWETSIYAGRAPEGKALLRVMIGGALDPHAVELDDEHLLQIVRSDLERTMRLRIAPEFIHLVRHARGIPQYTIGHTSRVERIDHALAAHPGIVLAGNAYRGVSVNACIEDARRVAALVAGHLASSELGAEYAAAR